MDSLQQLIATLHGMRVECDRLKRDNDRLRESIRRHRSFLKVVSLGANDRAAQLDAELSETE